MAKTITSPEFSRNYGFWSEDEQRALVESRVAIAGVGGDGFQLGLKLARMGVSQFSIADPEVFEPENVNRVEGATASSVGRDKAEVFRERVLDINPDAEVETFLSGVTPDNVEPFMHGASLVLDESELTRPEIGTLIARRARAQAIPDLLVMNIGFAAQVTSFAPDSAWTFERFMGFTPETPLAEIAEVGVDLSRCLPYIPPYTDLRSLQAVQGEDGAEPASLPSISIGVDLASAIGSAQAFLHLTSGVSNRRRSPVWAPRVAITDAYSLRTRILRAGRASHVGHLLVAAARDKLGKNPQGSYTLADIARRRSA
ncbi:MULTISPECIES: ThiF family adenylyltransferase [unclassified Leucobacter]|uniref:ThiF family adenylyltransferase n=1 Tax=unclassified Leucobacter TaxID=2621730 RepID=UPI00165D3DC1|nr:MULTISPECIES: ThiF family adenylyltransferase [unclassified Leucobacter]MBC9927819.1 ThiF family adenylyltransferase [Leucobacter sp. cx-169]MBC9936202.1 ThiF family adenylyltransferase [Leucobacter sp. cx-87]